MIRRWFSELGLKAVKEKGGEKRVSSVRERSSQQNEGHLPKPWFRQQRYQQHSMGFPPAGKCSMCPWFWVSVRQLAPQPRGYICPRIVFRAQEISLPEICLSTRHSQCSRAHGSVQDLAFHTGSYVVVFLLNKATQTAGGGKRKMSFYSGDR